MTFMEPLVKIKDITGALEHFEETSKDDPDRGHFGELVRKALLQGFIEKECLLRLGMTEAQIECALDGDPTDVDRDTREIFIHVIAAEIENKIISAQEFLNTVKGLQQANAEVSAEASALDWALEDS